MTDDTLRAAHDAHEVDRLTRGRPLSNLEIACYLADHQTALRHGTARVGDEIAEQLRDALAASATDEDEDERLGALGDLQRLATTEMPWSVETQHRIQTLIAASATDERWCGDPALHARHGDCLGVDPPEPPMRYASATDEGPRLQMSCDLATCDHECHDDPDMDPTVCDHCTGKSEQERAASATDDGPNEYPTDEYGFIIPPEARRASATDEEPESFAEEYARNDAWLRKHARPAVPALDVEAFTAAWKAVEQQIVPGATKVGLYATDIPALAREYAAPSSKEPTEWTDPKG